MLRKRPATQRKKRAPGKGPRKGEFVVGLYRHSAMNRVKYPSVFENLRQDALRQERLRGTKKKMRSAGGLGGATANIPAANFRPKQFGRGTAATRQGLRWDARSAAQPREEAESKGRKRLRR